MRPQAPGEPHGLRVRQARLGQELLGEARDNQHRARAPRGRGRDLRPGRRVRQPRRRARRRERRARPGMLGGAQPPRHRRRRGPRRRRQARVQDRRGARALERAHGRGPRGPAGARPLDHRPLRRRGVPGVREGRPPAHARRLPRGAARSARARGRRHRAALRALREGRVLLLQRPEQRGARQPHHQHRHARPRPEHARVRHDHGARDGAQPRDGNAAAPQLHLALHRRGAEPLRAPDGGRVLRPPVARGAQVRPHLHRHQPEHEPHAGQRRGPRHGAQLRVLPAAQAVHRRPRRMGGDAPALRHGARLHRRRRQARRGAAHQRGDPRPITDDFPKGPLYDLWNTKPAEVAEREMRRAAREAEE